MAETRSVKVWDGATRVFHWLLVFLLGFSWLSVEKGWVEWHMWSGYGVGALLIFRIVWGFFGSETARFSHFVASPFKAVAQLVQFHKKTNDTQIGHSAAGGWMVLLMLLLITVQVVTGLGTTDDIANEGPLVQYVSTKTSDTLTFLHFQIFTAIQIAVVLHVAAIAAYFIVKRHNLLFPMLHGRKNLPIDAKTPRMVHPARAWIVFIIAAGIMYLVAEKL